MSEREDEILLFRELELLYSINAEIRSSHIKYQSWYLLFQGFLVSLIVAQLKVVGDVSITPLPWFGLAVAIIFALMQWRYTLDLHSRMRRVKHIRSILERKIKINGKEINLMGEWTYGRQFDRFKYSSIKLVMDLIFIAMWVAIIISLNF